MRTIIAALALMFAVGTAKAADPGGWKGWYNDLLRGLKTKVQTRLQSRTRVSAVAAVRGADKNKDAFAPYWKDTVSESAQKKLADEKAVLTAAVEQVVNGDVEGGRAALKKFLKDNPDSFFAQDAKDALANLPAEEAVKPAAEEKPAGEAKPVQEEQKEGEKAEKKEDAKSGD
ncbi:MAG: hypothetical protein M0025_00425 [Elusimicrobia bacterium]|nr:hypothetical protein [Elusimicrobiota bacterium]